MFTGLITENPTSPVPFKDLITESSKQPTGVHVAPRQRAAMVEGEAGPHGSQGTSQNTPTRKHEKLHEAERLPVPSLLLSLQKA